MTEDSVERLIADLQDPDQRDNAIKTLGTLRDTRAIDPLVAVLQEPDAGHAMAYRSRQLAAEALGKIGDVQALPGLISALEDTNSRVRVAIARALGQIRTPQSIEHISILLTDEQPDVRRAAADALGEIAATPDADKVPAAALVPLLADTYDIVREAADRSLDRLDSHAVETLIQALDHHNSTIRGAVATLLGRIGDIRAVERLQEIRKTDSSRWVRSRTEGSLTILVPGEQRDQSDLEGLPSPKETLDLIRSQQPSWPTLQRNPPPPPPPAQEKTLRFGDMSADDIRAMLDHLDVRLAKGEITEGTYKMLVERWRGRLRELGES